MKTNNILPINIPDLARQLLTTAVPTATRISAAALSLATRLRDQYLQLSPLGKIRNATLPPPNDR